uniref:Uncharacterized protein n=1 Tax=Rhizophora mucronata TaxID=61149 RepID=A0A2P2NCM7_RHIMU
MLKTLLERDLCLFFFF